MFDKITIKPHNHFNVGILAESLLFYQETNLILAPGNIEKILNYCGIKNLVELIESGQLKIKFNPSSLVAGCSKDKILSISSFSLELHSKEKILKKIVNNLEDNGAEDKKRLELLMTQIQEHSYSADYQKILKHEVLRKENLISALIISSEGKLNENDIQLSKIEQIKNNNYLIETNLDSKLIHSAAMLMNRSTSEIYDSEVFKSAIVTNSKKSNYVENRLRRVLQKRLNDESQIQTFHELILPEFVDLKGTINSGAKNFEDYMNVWREARKFKDWLKNEEPSVGLLTKYHRKIIEKSWLDKIPTKNVRWLIFAATGTLASGAFIGKIGTSLGLGVDYFDDRIFDSILKKWRPNQFIEDEYKDFLNLRINN